MMRLGALEIVVILLVALIVFGGSKLSGVGKALGQSIREFRKELKEEEKPGDGNAQASEEKTDEKKS